MCIGMVGDILVEKAHVFEQDYKRWLVWARVGFLQHGLECHFG